MTDALVPVVVFAVAFWAVFTVAIRLVEGHWDPQWPLELLKDIVKP